MESKHTPTPEFIAKVRREIIRQARPQIINAPRIRGLKVNEWNGVTYRDVTCEILEAYTHPYTKEKCNAVYLCVFDGKLRMKKIS